MNQITPARANRPTSVTVIGWLFILLASFTIIGGILQVFFGLTRALPWFSALLPYFIIGMIVGPILYIVLFIFFLKGRGWARATIEINFWVGVTLLIVATIGLSILLPLVDNVIGDLSGGEALADFSVAPFLALSFIAFAIIGGIYGLLLYFLRKKDVRGWFQTTSHDYAIAAGIVVGSFLVFGALIAWAVFSYQKILNLEIEKSARQEFENTFNDASMAEFDTDTYKQNIKILDDARALEPKDKVLGQILKHNCIERDTSNMTLVALQDDEESGAYFQKYDAVSSAILLTSLNKLLGAVTQMEYPFDQMGLLTNQIGTGLLEENPGRAYEFFLCSAEKYGDPHSMLILSKIFFNGPEELKQFGVETDYSKSYFWIVSGILIDNLRDQIDGVVRQGLGLLDELQNVSKYVDEYGLDRAKVEKESAEFTIKFFPDQKKEELVNSIRSHYTYLLQEDPYDTFADESSLPRATTFYPDDLAFSLYLPQIPEDTFAIKKEEVIGLSTFAKDYPDVPITYTQFTVDAADTTWPEDRYDAFMVIAYPREWWDAHMTVDADGYLLLDGESDVITSGTFAGKNTNYAFTFSSSIECPLLPDNLNEETWQCDLAHTARQTVLPTFRAYN